MEPDDGAAATPARAAGDPLLERILYDCRLSGGTMPIVIIVADAAEKARGLRLLKGRHHNQKISFATEAERAAAKGGS